MNMKKVKLVTEKEKIGVEADLPMGITDITLDHIIHVILEIVAIVNIIPILEKEIESIYL